jgi:glyoxylase-like metal-dependent hydrolase (beta-lactamase superfamily II)
MGIIFVNVYVLNAGGGRWFLVDTGLPGFAAVIKAACEARFEGRPPEGIILTHAHFDHAGNVEQLATEWNVPVFAHRLEMPYLRGESDYPPADPTPGGAICFLSRFFPTGGYDLRGRVDLRELPEEGEEANTVPGLAGWRWIHTPGHSAGHVSLYREFDRMLIAGDALATMDMDSWTSQVSRKRELARPPTPFTPDWRSAHQSIDRLAELEPKLVAAGHGLPMSGRYVAGELAELSERLQPPAGGRYAGMPAKFDASGRVREVPPPAADPLKPKMGVAAALALAGIGIALFAASRRR